jgi:hypothetical protein
MSDQPVWYRWVEAEYDSGWDESQPQWELTSALVRALLEVDRVQQEDTQGLWLSVEQTVDAALTAAGLPDQASRDAAREMIRTGSRRKA